MIVCLGTTPVYQRSMVFERLTPDGVNRAAAVHDYASGKSVNVARVLHTLGVDAVATGFVGGDRGAALLRDLDRAGVRHDFVMTATPTRQCVTVIDRSRGSATELVEESAPLTPQDWMALELKLADLASAATGWVLSGSLPPGGSKDFYDTCIRDFCGRDVPVILDTRGQALRRVRLAPGNVIPKLNHDEFVETFGGSATSEEGLREHLPSLPPAMGCAVVTQGARGAIAIDSARELAWRIVPPVVSVKSAVGSGDAFAAGMMVELLQRKTIENACALGAACGAANAMTDLAGHVSADDVHALRRQVRIEPFPTPFT